MGSEMKNLRWQLPEKRPPAIYDCVILCYWYEDAEPGRWLVGAGYRHETGWTMLTHQLPDAPLVMGMELLQHEVCAWMEWPDTPRIALIRPNAAYRDDTMLTVLGIVHKQGEDGH